MQEVKRTANKDALICIMGYGRSKISGPIDMPIDHFYTEAIGNYWDSERKYIDENYDTIPFPFEEIKIPKFECTHQWHLEHLIGYLGTWSAVKHGIAKTGGNPLGKLSTELKNYWKNSDEMEVTFSMLLRIGIIK